MVAFERYASTAQSTTVRAPRAAERTGDFSDLCNAFNEPWTLHLWCAIPLSPIDSSGNRTTYFAGNVIPTGRLASAGTEHSQLLPRCQMFLGHRQPAAATTLPPQTSYASTYPSFIARFDQALGSKNKLNVIMFRSGLTQQGPHEGFPKEVGPGDCGVCYYHVYRNNRGGSVDDVHAFSSTMVLDSRLGIIYHPFGLVYPDNSGFDLSKIGIAGTGLPYSSFPASILPVMRNCLLPRAARSVRT